MMTDKTKKTLYWTISGIGFLVFVVCMACYIITDWSDVLPKSDWYHTIGILAWPICWLGVYFEPINEKQLENRGCLFVSYIFLILLMPLGWWFRIEHFTAPIIAALVIAGLLTILDIILFYKKSKLLKALAGEQEEEKEK